MFAAAPMEALQLPILPGLVRLDVVPGENTRAVVEYLVSLLVSAGRIDDGAEALVAGALARERTAPSGTPEGVALPSCRSEHVPALSLALARLSRPVDFGAANGRAADLVVLVALPVTTDDEDLRLRVKRLRDSMADEALIAALRAADSPERAARALAERIGAVPAAECTTAGR